ncbi:SsrA-binding protein SmpB [candidate division GN15 bacterium]|nr:SsrA-binding protein SmpB [candidate division GN15 bacterium]
MADKKPVHIVARNRKARHDYQIVDTIEAGIELMGAEVKSIREGKINLADSYAVVEEGQVHLKNLHITPYKMATGEQPEPDRSRRLLLHKREIYKLGVKTQQRGLTLIPLTIYIKGKLVKVELALATGRKKYDKRQAIAKAEADRRMTQATRKSMDD